jgi:multisubunit Na+/H+ antiporter MnhB subunit
MTRMLRWLPMVLLVLIGAGIGHAILRLPTVDTGLAEQVFMTLPASGVENPVTAVLLNFRGYDTLLEITVLTLAVIGIWSLAEMPRRRVGAPGLVLAFMVQILVPFMILLGAYLLWAGSHAPGGAFQAGAVFAAGMVLVLLAGAWLPRSLAGWPLRLLLSLGLLVFIAVGVAVMLAEGTFLMFPQPSAGQLMLLIEAAAAVSIGLILVSAFRGGRPGRGEPPV